MKKKIWACGFIFLILCGCVQQQPSSATSDISSDSILESSSLRTESEDSMKENSESAAEVGVNGMTEVEILELFMRKVNEANDFYFWLHYDCYEDINENLERIYDTDNTNPEGFYWLPLVRFETRKELYDYMGTVFRPRGVPNTLDWMFGDETAGPDEEWNLVYIAIFKEIDGRLYVRDRGYFKGERRKYFSHDFETAVVVVAEETEGKIAVDVRRDPKIVVGGDRFHLWFDDSNWVISRYPTPLY